MSLVLGFGRGLARRLVAPCPHRAENVIFAVAGTGSLPASRLHLHAPGPHHALQASSLHAIASPRLAEPAPCPTLSSPRRTAALGVCLPATGSDSPAASTADSCPWISLALPQAPAVCPTHLCHFALGFQSLLLLFPRLSGSRRRANRQPGTVVSMALATRAIARDNSCPACDCARAPGR